MIISLSIQKYVYLFKYLTEIVQIFFTLIAHITITSKCLKFFGATIITTLMILKENTSLI